MNTSSRWILIHYLKQVTLFLFIHLLQKETEHLFDAEAFKKMKDTAYLINVGRGPIIDEEALSDALNNNLIAGAGLDVFEKEPLPSTSPLYSVDPQRSFSHHMLHGVQ